MSCFKVVIRGGGDLGSGVAHRLFRAGMDVVILELPEPMVIRRIVAFADAVYTGKQEIEGVTALKTDSAEFPQGRFISVLVDPAGTTIGCLRPHVVVDARLAKKKLDTTIDQAPLVIGLGPGFTAEEDVHYVIETMRGHFLGRVISKGTAIPNTGIPSPVSEFTKERVLYAPCTGILENFHRIGEKVQAGEVIGKIGEEEVKAGISGVIRGLFKEGLVVKKNTKIGDIDPTEDPAVINIISDKARAVGGGVLEAILFHFIGREKKQ